MQHVEIPRVALDFMNEDHGRVIEIVNNLLEQIEATTPDAAQIGRELAALQQDCHDHFAREETLMQQYQFPPYGCHKREHQQVLEALTQQQQQWQEMQNPATINQYLDQHFIPWLSHHVSTMDFVTAQYIAGCQQNKVEPVAVTDEHACGCEG